MSSSGVKKTFAARILLEKNKKLAVCCTECSGEDTTNGFLHLVSGWHLTHDRRHAFQVFGVVGCLMDDSKRFTRYFRPYKLSLTVGIACI